MLEWCDRDLDKDDFFNFRAISGHRKGKERPGKWKVLVEWESGQTTWEPLATIFNNDPVTIAMCAQRNGLIKEWPQCKQCHNTLRIARLWRAW